MEDEIKYHKTYSIRQSQPGIHTFEVTFPPDVIDTEARRRNLDISEFLERYQAQAEYGGGSGAVLYVIVPRNEEVPA